MKSFLVTVAVATAALALGGCQDKRRPEPIPGPQSTPAHGTAALMDIPQHASKRAGASEISWFQGTLDEGFSRSCPGHRHPLLSF
jgi:hypothetical protein